ncbi:MAG TPA: hypothetical protein VK137_10555, partial [Planctomycetaceae bacterium]|nr:hypothetical protein [Planctomycetaceae bacterium]
RRWTLVLGVLQITVGCVVGFIPPSAVAWFRGLVMAHLEFTANGVLMVAFGFLVRELRLTPTALKVWFATLLCSARVSRPRRLTRPQVSPNCWRPAVV